MPRTSTAPPELAAARCVLTGQPLHYLQATQWPHTSAAVPVGTGPFTPAGLTEILAVTHDEAVAYPVVDGIPALIAREALSPAGYGFDCDGTDELYAEANLEHGLYTRLATASSAKVADTPAVRLLQRVKQSDAAPQETFPEPVDLWFGNGSTVGALHRAFSFLAPLQDETVLQVGGSGTHAVRMLLAGAASATVVSPFVSELAYGRAVAHHLGVHDRLAVIAGFAEQLPLAASRFTRAFAGSSMHHTKTDKSFADVSRVLTDGGRFASVDVWEAPLHRLGIRLFGKRNGNSHCVPMNQARIAPATGAFDGVSIAYHGALARYPLAVGARVGLQPPPRLAWALARGEDRLAAQNHHLQRHASLVSLCCIKELWAPVRRY